MAITRGHAWNAQTMDHLAWYPLFEAGLTGCREVVISCPTGAAASLKVAVASRIAMEEQGSDTIHRMTNATTPAEYFVLAAGQQLPFAMDHSNPIRQVFVQSDSAIAESTVTGTITAK